jgi:small subunit ribosomal protein S6
MTEATKKLGREYETIYVLRPTVTPEVIRAVSDRVIKVLDQTGGTLTGVENWGRREMAYRVEKFQRGVYVLVRYIGTGETVSEIERNFRVVDDVMKYQTVLINDAVKLDETTSVEFEQLELTEDDAPEVSLAEELGLVEVARRRHNAEEESQADESEDDDSSSDSDSDADEASESKKEAE